MAHELVTNAVKYVALSVSEGQMEVAWRLEGEAEHSRLTIVWQEMGSPPARQPERKGFGSEFIEREVAMDLGGKAILDSRPEGLLVTLISPLLEASNMKVL